MPGSSQAARTANAASDSGTERITGPCLVNQSSTGTGGPPRTGTDSWTTVIGSQRSRYQYSLGSPGRVRYTYRSS